MFKAIVSAPFRQRSWPAWALTYLNLFRVVVVGSCVALLVVGWLEHVQWLLMAGSCIGIGEFLESSYYIAVLRWAERTGRLPTELREIGGGVCSRDVCKRETKP